MACIAKSSEGKKGVKKSVKAEGGARTRKKKAHNT